MATSEHECWLAERHSPVAELLKSFDITGARWSLDLSFRRLVSGFLVNYASVVRLVR